MDKTLHRPDFDKRAPVIRTIITYSVIIALGALSFFIIGFYDYVSDVYTRYRANHLSSAGHLRVARNLCHILPSGEFLCVQPYDEQAMSHLRKIPESAPEHTEAEKLVSLIELNRQRLKALHEQEEKAKAEQLAQREAERKRLMSQSVDESRIQMFRNISGGAHDPFTCTTSPQGAPVMSFDYGHYWWNDDGRCAAQQAAQQAKQEQFWQQMREQQKEGERQKRAEEQKRRDEDAELYSYWPTKLRVHTDIDSSWMKDEERTCQTYPDDKGRVAVVACNASGSHRDHNIPVTFWGGVDRNTVSEWKCRREGEDFACRALD